MPSLPSQTINSARKGTGPRRPTTARQPVIGLPVSLVLHGFAIASIFFVFNSAYSPPEESHAVPVDLVTLAEQTNIAAAPPPPQEEPIKRDLEPLPPPEPKLVPAEPAPDIKPPKFTIEDKPRPPDTRQDITRLLAQLTAPDKLPRKNAEEASQSAGLANAMNASLADMLRSQIRNCWSPIAGAPNPADQIVSFDLRLNPDGTIASIETLTISSNPYTAAAVSAAERAIYQCSPYRLPRESYSQWRQFRPLRFDPRQMVQQ
jgi:hypothetical protein